VVFSLIRLLPTAAHRARVLDVLSSVQRPTRREPACLGIDILVENSPAEGIVYVECWESEASLHEHVRSDLYRRVLVAIELCNHAPKIAFHYISATKGFEFIEAVRNLAPGIEPPSPPQTRPT